MANRAGSLRTGLTDTDFPDSVRGGRPGAIRGTISLFGETIQRWKNVGWYAAGATYEVWTSIGDPETTPPSAHTLTQHQHYLLMT